MLGRSLRRSLRDTASISSRSTCTICKCTCGRTLLPNGPLLQQNRSYAIKSKPVLKNPYARSLEVKKRKQELEEWEATRYYESLQHAKQTGRLSTTVDEALSFLNEFVELAKVRRTRTGSGVDVEAFKKLLSEYRIENDDAKLLSDILTADLVKLEHRALGRKLMYTMSASGDMKATLRIIIQVILERGRSRSLLKSADLVPTRKHLTAMAENGLVQAMVLEGRVAYILGDVDYAIQMWTDSLDDAVALEQMFSMRSNRPQDSLGEATIAPWIELATVHALREEHEKAKWAIKIGCEQDDPTSHFQALQYVDTDSSEWLYHVTKAAGAGHVTASHLLGYWYGFSDWKYLEDEPPAHIKPTPFDSFPPESQKGTISILSRLRASLGLKSRIPDNVEAKDRLFLTAAFPSTAYDRFKMALQWLELSMALFYAPSYLVAVNLLLQKTLYASATAPPEALSLNPKRYTYASAADFYANNPIPKSNPPSKQEEKETKEIPNPGYNPTRAKNLLREILYAAQAQTFRRQLLSSAAEQRKSGKNLRNWDEDQLDEEALLFAKASENLAKWSRYPESREMYTDEAKNRLWDYDLGLDLEVEATRICDEQGWDIYDGEEGLMYRYGSLGGRVLPPKMEGWLNWNSRAFS